MTQAKITLTADDSPLRRTLSSARESLNKFGADALSPFAKIRDAFGNLGNIMAGVGAIKIIGLADQAALIQARIKDVAGSFEAANTAQAQLYAASQRLQVGYADLAGSFAKMLPAVREMGGGTNEAIRLSEILSTTARLAGASTQEAASSAQQFGQALASGALKGDELNAILEGNGTLARAMAQGLGVSVGELKKLGSEGKLTSDKVASALLGQYDQIQARSAELPATVGGAWTQITNAFQNFIAKANEGTGVFGVFSAILSSVAKLLDAVTTALSGAAKGSDNLGRNQSVKLWADAVIASFAYVIDLGRAVWEGLALVGKQIAAIAAAATFAAKGQFSNAAQAWREYESDFVAGWERIKNLVSGGEGSTLQTFALGGGQTDGPATKNDKATKLRSKGGGGKDESQMPAYETALERKKAALAEQGRLHEVSKTMELAYWQSILSTTTVGEKDKTAIDKKMATLRLDIAKDAAKQKEAIEKDAMQTYRELALGRLEGERIATEALADQGIISKAEAIEREIQFEERRYQIAKDYLDRRIELAEGDPVEQARLQNDKAIGKQDHKNNVAQLKAKQEKESPVRAITDDIGNSFGNGLEAVLNKTKSWRQSMIGIFNDIKASFIKHLVVEPFAAMVAGWARQLAAKLGFTAQEKAAEKMASAETITTKGVETGAVVSAEAAKAGAGAAASQAAIPIIGPGLALGAMAAIFAAVMAMGSKRKSASKGYDIPSGVNPLVQAHEEEMILPKEQANAVRQMAKLGLAEHRGGNGGGVSQSIHVKAMDARSVVQSLRSGGALQKALRGMHRDFVKV